MDTFDTLYEKFITPTTSISVKPLPIEERFYISSGFTSNLVLDKNKTILSNIGYSTITSYNKVLINQSNDVKIGLLGIYRRAYPRTSNSDYGYLEETRIVTKVGLYSSNLVLELSPVIYIEYTEEGRVANCGPNKVDLILYKNSIPPQWLRLEKGHYIRGCSFDAKPVPESRTLVIDGRYVEKNGSKSSMSANLIVPNRFIQLFKESLDDDPIIWW